MRMAGDLCALGGVPLLRRLETVRAHSLVRERRYGARFGGASLAGSWGVNMVDAPYTLVSVPLAQGLSAVCADVRVRAPRNGAHLGGANLKRIRSFEDSSYLCVHHGRPSRTLSTGQSPDRHTTHRVFPRDLLHSYRRRFHGLCYHRPNSYQREGILQQSWPPRVDPSIE